MNFSDDINNSQLRNLERHGAGRHNKRAALVTAWNPKTHRAKVMFQPEGHETGWLPVHTMAAGDGFGLMTGLTPGDGLKTGDQVEVVYQEGDFETGAIVARIHSDVDKPPELQSGEHLLSTALGQSIKLAQDKSITVTHPNGNYMTLDAQGNIISHLADTSKKVYLGGDPAKSGVTMLGVKLADDSVSPFVMARKS